MNDFEKLTDILSKKNNDTEKIGALRTLFTTGVNVNNEVGQKGYTALHWTAGYCSVEVVKCLVEEGKADVNVQNETGFSPLHWAAAGGNLNERERIANKENLDVAKYLADKGADVNTKSKGNFTILHAAAMGGNLDIVKYLVEEKKLDVKAKDNFGCTVLQAAINSRREGVVGYLEKIIKQKEESGRGIATDATAFPACTNNVSAESQQRLNKSIKHGVVYGLIAASVVGATCLIIDIELPLLAIVSIAAATALAIGIIAGGITYAVSNKLDESKVDAQVSSVVTSI